MVILSNPFPIQWLDSFGLCTKTNPLIVGASQLAGDGPPNRSQADSYISKALLLGTAVLIRPLGRLKNDYSLNDLPEKADRLSWRGINPGPQRFAAD